LRQSTTIVDGPEPEEVLETLLGITAHGVDTEEPRKLTITEDDLDFDFDFAGLSLRDLAQEDTAVEGGTVYRAQTVEECMFRFCLGSRLPLEPLMSFCWWAYTLFCR
jgi:hypothetical protein